MKLEAGARLNASQELVAHEFLNTLQKMSEAQLTSLAEALNACTGWFSELGYGKAGHGKLLLSSQDLTPQINGFAWLTSHLASSIRPPTRVFRQHLLTTLPKVGQIVHVQPFKPILSWSKKENFEILEDLKRKRNVLLELDHPNLVIWSVAIANAVNKSLRILAKPKYEDGYALARSLKGPVGRVISLTQTLVNLTREFGEAEVIVYHGNTPFTAKVIKHL